MESIEDFSQELLIYLFDGVYSGFPREIMQLPSIQYMQGVNTAVYYFREELFVNLERLFSTRYELITDSDDEFMEFVKKHCSNICSGHYYTDWILICTFVVELVYYSIVNHGCLRFFNTASKCLVSIFKERFETSFVTIGGWKDFRRFCIACITSANCLKVVEKVQDSTNNNTQYKKPMNRRRRRYKKGSNKPMWNSSRFLNGPTCSRMTYETVNINPCRENVNKSPSREAESAESLERFAEEEILKSFTVQCDTLLKVFTHITSIKNIISNNDEIVVKTIKRYDSSLQIIAEHDASSLCVAIENGAGSHFTDTCNETNILTTTTEGIANAITTSEVIASGTTNSESIASGTTNHQGIAKDIFTITEGNVGNIGCVAEGNASGIQSVTEGRPDSARNTTTGNAISKVSRLHCTDQDDSCSLYSTAEDDSDNLYITDEDEASNICNPSNDNVGDNTLCRTDYLHSLQTEAEDHTVSLHPSQEDKAMVLQSTTSSACGDKTLSDNYSDCELMNSDHNAVSVNPAMPCSESETPEDDNQHTRFQPMSLPLNDFHNSVLESEKVICNFQMGLSRDLDWRDVLSDSDEDWRKAIPDSSTEWREAKSDSDSDHTTIGAETYNIQTPEKKDPRNNNTAARDNTGFSPAINRSNTIDGLDDFKIAPRENLPSISEDNVKAITSGSDDILTTVHKADVQNLTITSVNDASTCSKTTHHYVADELKADDEKSFSNDNVVSTKPKASDLSNESKQSIEKVAGCSGTRAVDCKIKLNSNVHSGNELPVLGKKPNEYSQADMKKKPDSFRRSKRASSDYNSRMKNVNPTTENDSIFKKSCSGDSDKIMKIASEISKFLPNCASDDLESLAVLMLKIMPNKTNARAENAEKILKRRQTESNFPHVFKFFLENRHNYPFCDRCKRKCLCYVNICLNLYKSKYLSHINSYKN